MQDRPRNLQGAAALFFVLAVFIVLILTVYDANRGQGGNHRSKLGTEEIESVQATAALISDQYVDEVDLKGLAIAAQKGMVTSLDPYCTFLVLDKPEARLAFDEQTTGTHSGVGVALEPCDSEIVIRYPYPGSPAERAGLKPKDRIVSINGHSTAGLDYHRAEAMLKGQPGLACRIGYQRPGAAASAEIEIICDYHKVCTVFGDRILDSDAGIGYLRIRSFGKDTRQEVTAAIEHLESEGARGVVIDLRGNLGGLLESSLTTANLFVGEGVLVETRGRYHKANNIHRASLLSLRFPRMPLVLLVDGETASAAEVFAGALQDHRRATLVGTRTFGKGLVQTVITKHGAQEVAIKLTTARYYLPLGRRIDRRRGSDTLTPEGLEPDHVVAMAAEDQKALKQSLRLHEVPNAYLEAALGQGLESPAKDVQLNKAVEVLKKRIESIAPATGVSE